MLLWEHATTLKKTLIPNAAMKPFSVSLQGSRMYQFVKTHSRIRRALHYTILGVIRNQIKT